MGGEMDDKLVLDYAIFLTSPSRNSYEALACYDGKREQLANGPLDQLMLHLREACSSQNNSFKLQVAENINSSWFTKGTLERFLNIVNMPEVLTIANAIENEMSQLEETRRSQLTLYAKGHPDHSEGGNSDCSTEVKLADKVKVETASSDATKNELLKAMDLRLLALKEELNAAFNRAAGAVCSIKQISDLVAFAQNFEATDLRNCLMKYLTLISKDQPHFFVEQLTESQDLRNTSKIKREETRQFPRPDVVKPITNGISPAKIAEAERRSSESDESTESSDEDSSFAERSRPLIRSASPRRSASPMRRIQIGRSGSRRSTALTIKSLNYYPARDKTFSNRDADGTNSGDEESKNPSKRVENSVRMSVQDAISLFERKQKDQTIDVQKRKTSEEAPVSTSKSVLRRWSAGMGDSFTHCSREDSSDAGSQNTSINLPSATEEKKMAEIKAEHDSVSGSSVENAQVNAQKIERMASPPMDSPAEPIVPKAEEINDRATASAEWSRQKEAELNQMLMKMMESKPGKYQGINAGSGGHQGISNVQGGSISREKSGGFYSQYKEKRDEKLRSENVRTRAAKEAQFRVMQETLEQNKAAMASKKGSITGKQNPVSNSQKPRRNSSPPVLAKKEVSKPPGSRKASPKPSSLSNTRSSWSSGSLPRTVGTPPAKPSTPTASTNSTPNRRKSQPPPSLSKPSPRTEKPAQQPKIKKTVRTDANSSLKVQEEKQQNSVTKTTRSVKTKNPSASGDDSSVKSAKPSFYNKVTKKNSVVPLESKPFLRKGTGIGPGVGPVLAKTKVTPSIDSPKDGDNLVRAEETEPTVVTEQLANVVLKHDPPQTEADNVKEVSVTETNMSEQEIVDNSDHGLDAEADNYENSEIHAAEIEPDEDMGISSAAWVEVERQDISASCDNDLPGTTTSPGLAPVASSSPHVRHSLSQMLQADNCEPDVIEWGNAENPPSMIYQKDAPKGFKRLLKFARKNKCDPNTTGWASPSVFSEGEDDLEESKAVSKRSSDALMRKAAIQTKVHGHQKNMLSESFDGDSKRAMDYRRAHDILSGQSSVVNSEKFREGLVSASATSTSTSTSTNKATRSFFSLSTFRSGKSSETKLR